MGDKNRGLYRNDGEGEGKFIVTRTDGSSDTGGKHMGCWYFVLDLTHDPHAIPAMIAYADSCRKDGYELLAADILEAVAKQLRDDYDDRSNE